MMQFDVTPSLEYSRDRPLDQAWMAALAQVAALMPKGFGDQGNHVFDL